MAKRNKKEEEKIVNVDVAYTGAEKFVNDNKNALTIFAVALVAIVGGYFAIKNLYLEPRETAAAELMWKPEYYFEVDSLNKAINGDDNYLGFEYIADNYGSTAAGNLAKFYLGNIYLRLGEYNLAIDYLRKSKVNDPNLGAMVHGLQGDAFVELGDLDAAAKAFENAVKFSDNNFTAPLYLIKAARVYEELGQYGKAADKLKVIIEKYPKYDQLREVEKQHKRASVLAGR
ncbi:MAG: tetratricopeptide repeat protein [Luteibaculaceae bacterium]